MNYWHAVCEKYHIKADFINDSYDPRFTFMTYDADGKVRMDCSSPYVMAGVIKDGRSYDLVLANDPDYDRSYPHLSSWGCRNIHAFCSGLTIRSVCV